MRTVINLDSALYATTPSPYYNIYYTIYFKDYRTTAFDYESKPEAVLRVTLSQVEKLEMLQFRGRASHLVLLVKWLR
jgi:hypothetical protein